MSGDGHGVSAIVVSYYTGPALDHCLAALEAADDVAEIVLVDNGNPEPVEAALVSRAASNPRLRLLRGHGNVGFAAGCNLGARAARGAAFLFINPDAIVEPGAAKLLWQAAEAAGTAPVVAGGRVLNPDGSEQRGCRRETFTPWRAITSFSGLSRLERLAPAFRDLHRERDPLPAGPAPMPVISGSFFLLRRADFALLEGLDEGYFLHVEDIDLCRRAAEAGGMTLFHPHARAVHWRSTSAAPRLAVERHKAAGFRRYFRKFARTPLDKALAAVVSPLIEAALVGRARLWGRG